MDMTFNGYNSERFPPIKKNLAYYFPLDETFQCCVQDFKYTDILCMRNVNTQDGDLYKKFFLELGANIRIAHANYDDFTIPSDIFSMGKYNAIIIDAVGYEVLDSFKLVLKKISTDNQIPILVLNDNINEEVYNVGGVSVLYFTTIPSNEILLRYIEKGIRLIQGFSYELRPDCVLVKDTISIPIHDNISDYTISISFKTNTNSDNNLIFSIENNNEKVVSIVYNKTKNELVAEFKNEREICKIKLDNKYHKLSITKKNRLIKIYLNSTKLFEYQYDTLIKPNAITLGCSGSLGYSHITNNFYRDLWVYYDRKGDEDVELLSKSILTVLS